MSFKKTVATGALALSVIVGAGSAYAAPASQTTIKDSSGLYNSASFSELLQSLQNQGWNFRVIGSPDSSTRFYFGGYKYYYGTTPGSNSGSDSQTDTGSDGNTATPTTPSTPTTPTTPSTGSGSGSTSNGQTGGNTGSNAASAYAEQVVSLVNQERAEAGLAPLTSDSALANMALDKAKDMYNNNYFDHTSPTYGSPFDMMSQYGIRYSYAGENIAKGQRNPEEVMNAWMNSEGHRQNILSANFAKIGVAYYNGVWVQEFIK
ncbi:MAG: hypothetical protein K0Q59_3969 [Paenibacillus sp.]|jgi:uncharacterized YkwD family protein|nr:hypothetical protein [Paenibacillus sp.]